MRKKYKNPPIEEAVVEFRFALESESDLTIPGKLHEHPNIKRQYPGRPRTQKLLEPVIPAGSDQPVVREGVRVQLVNDNGNRLISLGLNVLSVNVLRPYDGWDQFQPRVETALRAYTDVAQPTGISRIGVRYINKIIVPRNDIKIEDYIQYHLPAGSGLPTQLVGFWNRIEYKYDEFVKLLFNQVKVEAPEGQTAFVLDLDVYWEATEAISLDSIMKIVDDLHKREGEAFEAIITDATRELFDGE